jgi:alpha-N-arabinofuranosidase
VDEGGLTVFAVNRDPSGHPLQLAGTLRGFPKLTSATHEVLSHPDLKAVNSADNPNNVRPCKTDANPSIDGESICAILPPLSWNVIRFAF